MTQPSLFPTPPRLTIRQQAVLDALHDEPMQDWEAGAIWHDLKGRHSRRHPCDYCPEAGRLVLTELRRKGLVVRRRTGLWEALSGPARAGYDPDNVEIPFGR